MNIEVIREAEDRLSRSCWQFRVDSSNGACIRLIPCRYRIQARETTRHKYAQTAIRSGWHSDYNGFPQDGMDPKKGEVPFPEDVLKQAVNIACSKVTVHFPEGYKH